MEDKLFTIGYYAAIIIAIYFTGRIIALFIGWTQASKIPVYAYAQEMGKNPDYLILKGIIKNIAYVLIFVAIAYLLKK